MSTHAVAASPSPGDLTKAELRWGLIFGLWMVVGLFLDGWAHDDGRQESFFTPWHAVLYSGFAATTLAALLVVRRRHRRGRPLREAVPDDHRLTLLGLVGFSIGAIGDLLWHEGFGVEVGVEALLSPTHLLLFASGLLVLSAPLRTAWHRPGVDIADLRSFLPVLVNLALLTAVSAFFVAYLSPFVNDAASQAFDPRAMPHDHPSNDVDELQQMLGLASILMTTVVLAVPLHALLRRWRTPPGALTVLTGLSVFFLVGLDQYREWYVVLAGIGAGAVIDALWRRWGRLVAVAAGIGSLWIGYFALRTLFGDPVVWSAELIAGAVVLGALVGGAVGLPPDGPAWPGRGSGGDNQEVATS